MPNDLCIIEFRDSVDSQIWLRIIGYKKCRDNEAADHPAVGFDVYAVGREQCITKADQVIGRLCGGLHAKPYFGEPLSSRWALSHDNLEFVRQDRLAKAL